MSFRSRGSRLRLGGNSTGGPVCFLLLLSGFKDGTSRRTGGPLIEELSNRMLIGKDAPGEREDWRALNEGPRGRREPTKRG